MKKIIIGFVGVGIMFVGIISAKIIYASEVTESKVIETDKAYIDEVLSENGYTLEPLSDDEMTEMDAYIKKYPNEFSYDRTVLGKVKDHENTKTIEVAIEQTNGLLNEIQATNFEDAREVRKEKGLSFVPIFLNQ